VVLLKTITGHVHCTAPHSHLFIVSPKSKQLWTYAWVPKRMLVEHHHRVVLAFEGCTARNTTLISCVGDMLTCSAALVPVILPEI
jgi:hypothetical protein